MVGEYSWILFVLAGLVLQILGRGHPLLRLGILGLGLTGFLQFLAMFSLIPWELVEMFRPIAWLGSVLLIVLGIIGSIGKLQKPNLGGYMGTSIAEQSSLVIPRNESNSFARALRIRDELCKKLMTACKNADIETITYTSRPEDATVWIRLDYVLPQEEENLSLRSSLTVYVERFDFHRFEHLFTLKLRLGNRIRTFSKVIEINESDIELINEYLSNRGTPPFLFRQTRTGLLQFWRPLNKVERLRTDWLAVGLGIAFVPAMFLLLLIPIVGIFLAAILGIGIFFYLRRRKVYILTTGRPLHDPRSLIRMDSWQTNVASLAVRHDEVRSTLLDRLQSNTETGVRVVPEHIWYPGPDGKIEREQITLTFRRATAFVHLEAYGQDLFIGWDSHVNAGTWIEKTLSRGIDRVSGKPVVANRVTSGWSVPNEYDLIDVSFLSEWLHSVLTRVVKLKIEEHRIDQEIDFTVQRESRRDAMERREEGAAGGLLSGLRRVG